MGADPGYFHRRAEEEIAQAQACDDERLVQFHYLLAGFYLDLVYGREGDPRFGPGGAVAPGSG
jgi:hypothetical protein